MLLKIALKLRELSIKFAQKYVNLYSKLIVKSSDRVRLAQQALDRLEKLEEVKREEYTRKINEASNFLNGA